MAEPSATTVAFAASGITLSTLLLGLDGNAVVGAFAGAALMACTAKDVRWLSRLLYLTVSWLMGYIAAPEICRRFGIEQSGVAAFIAAALVVTITLHAIESIKSFDVAGWLRRRFGGGA